MMSAALRRTGLPVIILTMIMLNILTGCTDSYPADPYSPDDDELLPWEDVLAADSAYPDNVYLTENIEFNPGPVGSARIDPDSLYYDGDGIPYDSTKNGACGPPEGCGAVYSSSTADMTVLGSGGSAVWRFDPDWVIIDGDGGDGNDFITFSNHNVFGRQVDDSWNELAHVYASEDNVNWYKCSESFDENTSPGTANGDYIWENVSGMHGNNHSWANFREDVEAEVLDESTGEYEYLTDNNGDPVMISKYFTPDADNLGGDRFDLADFVHTVDGSAWPSGGKMRYIKFVDAPESLDGQDYSPAWMTGARIMAAMGINVEQAD